MSSDELEEKTDAYVTCRDGKIRYFTAKDGEVFHYKGRKYTYLLWDEPEGRGFITMFVYEGKHLLAPNHMQPVLVEAKTWAGRWNWVGVNK
jgi:hypothetical protein